MNINMINKIGIKLLSVLFTLSISGCVDTGDDYESDFMPHISIKNNTEMEVVVIFIPTDLPDKLITNHKYSTVTNIASGEIGKCNYFISYYGYFFSTGEELSVIVADHEVYEQSGIKEIVNQRDKQLTQSTLSKTKFLETDGRGRINQSDNQIELVWGL